MPEPSPERADEAADEPFLSWADEAFDPGLGAASAEERTARALEYIAYQLFHIRLALGEIAAAAEPPDDALAGTGRVSRIGRRRRPARVL
jgi:hypothetical protein